MNDTPSPSAPSGAPAAAALAPAAFPHLPLGAVRPAGWLRDQLRIQAEGLSGHLGAVWADCGPDSGWRGGGGEAWERGPYYLDGLVPLAHLLGDEDAPARALAEPFLEFILGSQRPDGFFGPAANDDWWPRMVAAKALTQHAEATGDPRVLPLLLRYFRHQLAALPQRPLRDWGQARAADNVLSVFWAFERSGEPCLLDLAALLLRQGIDWAALHADWPYRVPQEAFDHRVHVVNVAQGLKYGAVRSRLPGGDAAAERRALEAGLAAIWGAHGQAHGMFAGDEWLAGTDPARGVETCAVVEALFSFEQVLEAWGGAAFGDRIERIAYNALPAAQSADLWLHQYDQQVNQVRCTAERRRGWSNSETANLFGLEPNFGCCTANLHQGWPKVAARLWARSPDGGLAALVYAPCTVRAHAGAGTGALPGGASAAGLPGACAVQIEVETGYPFREEVRIRVRPEEGAAAAAFPLHLRVPGWCRSGTCAAAGEAPVPLAAGGWHTVERTWRRGDEVVLRLPMEAERERRPSGGAAVRRGPLVFALPVPEGWRRRGGEDPAAEYELLPEGPWNYGLVRGAAFEPRTAPIPRQPFAAGAAPVRLAAACRRVPGWGLDGPSAAAPPVPAQTEQPVEEVELVPYGSARLRIAEFPEVEG